MPTNPASPFQYIAKLAATSAYSKANEPGVLSYAVCVPRDEADQKTIYMLEAYTDQAALDAHMKIDNVTEMIKWMGANTVFEAPPTVLELDVIEDFGLFMRPDAIDQAEDPYIVVGEVTYKDGALVEKSLPHWAKVVHTTKTSEPGSLVYALTRGGVAGGAAEPNKLYTLEVYTDKDYLWDVHAKSQAVQDNVRSTKEWREGVKHHMMKKVHGYLAKSKI